MDAHCTKKPVAEVDAECEGQSVPVLPKRRLSPATASETVLTNATLLQHIVSFQDGLPGLLCELKRMAQQHGGYELDLPTAAATQGKLRAFEMIDALPQTPHNAYHSFYSTVAYKACELGNAAILRWIINCPTIERRLKRKELKEMWETAVIGFKPGNVGIFELLAPYFTSKQLVKLNPEIWEGIHDVTLLQWFTERFEIKLSTNMLWGVVQVGYGELQRFSDEFLIYWLSHRPEPLVKGMLAHVLPRVDADLFLRTYLKRVHDDDERLNLLAVATWEEDLTKLRLLYSDQERFPFKKAPIEALESAAERGRLEFVQELYSRHEGITSDRAFELAAANGHTHVVEFLTSRRSVNSWSGK